jgi:hypothetical protein
MLSEHGSSTTSRKKGADIAGSIADVASGAVPRGMKRSGKRKVAAEGFGNEKYVDDYVPASPAPSRRAFDKPKPPSAKSGTVLVGSKPPTDLPDFNAKGPRMVQDKLPGTGVPRTVSEEVSPAKVTRGSGPLEKRAYELEGTRIGKSTWKLEDFAPKIETAPAVRTTRLEPTDRDFKPQSNPNRGQQFALDTTDMTGAGEVSALKKSGSLVPSGKKTKKTKPMVQPSMFPDFSVKEGRSNAFYMAGSVKPISEASKQLQGDAKKRFGRKEDAIAVEGGYAGADDAKLEQPSGSRADKKNTKKLDTES